MIAARLNAPRTSGPAGRFGASVLAGALLVLSSGTSRAADPGPAPSAESRPAERLAEEAYELHAQGNYPEAIATYLKAYEISRATAILFNIATIYDRKLHERELASDYYRRYLGSPDPEPDLVEKATERLTALKHETEATAPTVPALPTSEPVVPAVLAPPSPGPSSAMPGPPQSRAPAPTTTPMDLPSRRNVWRTTGIVIGSAGAIGIGASLALGLAARNKNDDANALCSDSACTGARGVTFAQQAGDFATASTMAFVAGLACIGGGLAMYFAGPGAGAAARLSLAPQLDTRTAAMSVRLGF